MKTHDSTGKPLASSVPDDFFTAYLVAALWSSTDDDGTPLDSNYTAADIAPESLDSALHDCAGFFQYCEETGLDPLPDYGHSEYINAEMSGHDFWLTRNGHGAGYWDRGLETGDALSAAAETFGTSDVYVGDDGSLYFS